MALGFVTPLMFIVVMLGLGGSVSANVSNNDTVKYDDLLLNLSNFTQSLMFRYEDVNVSKECAAALAQYAIGLLNADEWARKMFDATSKVQSGILAGNVYNLGAYDECQSIRSVAVNYSNAGPQAQQAQRTRRTISGKYCLGAITLQGAGVLGFPISLMWSLCVPDACGAYDLNEATRMTKLPLIFTEKQCHTSSQDPSLTRADIAVIACFSVILALMVASGLYDLYLRHFRKSSAHPLLLAFSMVTNAEKVFALRKSAGGGEQMECLNGIRSLSMMWIIQGHIFSVLPSVAVSNVFAILDFINDGWTMYARGATVAVDSFFLMAGIVMTYVYLKSAKELQRFNVLRYYLHRYLRLTPALAAMLAVHATVIRHFNSGPYGHVMNDQSYETCRKYWWSVLLYIQNYANPYELCLGQSWYLSVDTQLFFISPIFLLPLRRWPKRTLAMVLIAAMASIASGFSIAWIYRLRDANALVLTAAQVKDYITKYYSATYTRAAPWLIGIIIGYCIHHAKRVRRGIRINKYVNLALWCCALAVLSVCVFYDHAKDEYDRLAQSVYIALSRPAWALALSWVIFACATGYGGWVNVFLSAPIFHILARLTYSMYLTHFTIITVAMYSTRQPLVFSNARAMYEFWSAFAVILAVSIVWTLAFESPVVVLEKYLMGGAASKPQMAHRTGAGDLDFGGQKNGRQSSAGGRAKGRDDFVDENLAIKDKNLHGVENNSYVHNEPLQNGGTA